MYTEISEPPQHSMRTTCLAASFLLLFCSLVLNCPSNCRNCLVSGWNCSFLLSSSERCSDRMNYLFRHLLILGLLFVCWKQHWFSFVPEVDCPYEIFNFTKCLRFLFVFIILDLRKKTKKRFWKSVNIFLRYEFFCI